MVSDAQQIENVRILEGFAGQAELWGRQTFGEMVDPGFFGLPLVPLCKRLARPSGPCKTVRLEITPLRYP